MAIFGFGKKDDENETGTFVRKTNLTRALSEDNMTRDDEEFRESEINKDEFIKNASALSSAIKELEIDDIEEDTNKEEVTKESVDSESFDLDFGSDDDFDEARLKELRDKIFESAKIDLKIAEKSPATEVPTPQVEAKKEEEKKEFSMISILATSRPLEIAFDLSCRYLDDKYYKLDILSNNFDLESLVKSNPRMKYLDVSNCELVTDFSKIANLTELEGLDLSGCRNINDFSFLGNLKQLKVLNLGDTNIESFKNFPAFPNLEVLNVKMNRIRNLSGLESCRNLHDLILWGCTSLEDISVVRMFSELRLLDLDACRLVKDIFPISNLNKLMYLNLNDTRVEDLKSIKNLSNLEIFTMDFCPVAMSEQNLTYFENLTKMKFLGLSNRMIRNLYYFRNMTQLADLELGGNAISDLSPLENLTELQVLNLNSNPSLVDISPLYRMKKLKKLHVSGLKAGKEIAIAMLIEDISVVKELSSLEVFESNYNKKIKDISPLQYCGKLEEAHFNDCFRIADVTPLRFCSKLKELNIENCTQIRDVSFVKYFRDLETLNIAKTSVDRMLISDLSTLVELKGVKDTDGTLPIHKSIVGSIKYRKKITKISKKVLKESK